MSAHCDPRVVHAKGTCKFCDMYPEKQQERIDNNVNFTGENDPNKKPCPAEIVRSIETIEAWPRNRATK